jgi:hypothetical protein
MIVLHRWRFAAALCLLLLTVWSAAPIPVAASGSVTLHSITFYSAKHYLASNCTPRGKPSKSFRTTVSTIYAQIIYASWVGSHVQQSKWYSPDGSVYATSQSNAFVGHGGITTCFPLVVAGDTAAQLPGRWKYTVLVDKKQVGEAYFKLKAVTPP